MASDIHANLLTNLEAALDVRKMMSVFSSLVGILKDQQGKIDDLASKVQTPVTLERLQELEKKVADIELFTKGGGLADDAVLNENTLEVSPFVAFHRAAVMTQPTPRDSNEEQAIYDPSDQEIIEKIKSSRPSFKTSSETERAPSVLSSRVQSRKPSRRPSPDLSKQGQHSQAVSRKPSISDATQQSVHDEIDKVANLLEEVKDDQPKTRPITPKLPLPLQEVNDEDNSIVSVPVIGTEPQLENESVDLSSELLNSVPEPSEEVKIEEPSVQILEAEAEVEEETKGEMVIEDQEQKEEPAPNENIEEVSVLAESTDFTSAENLVSQSADELEIGEVTDLPQIPLLNSISDLSTDHKKRSLSRQISDGGKSVTRKSIHPREMPKDIQNMYGAHAPSSRKNTPNVTPHATPRSTYEIKNSQLTRRKMTLRNLPFLTQIKRDRILQELTNRGRFLRIAREMLDEQRKAYSTQSLKQKVDYLETEIDKLSNKLNKLRDNTKRNNVSIKEGFSYIKQQNDNFQSQLSALEEDLQELVYKKRTAAAQPNKPPIAGLPTELLNDESFMKLLQNASTLNEMIHLIVKAGGGSSSSSGTGSGSGGGLGGLPAFEKLLRLNSKSTLLTSENFEEQMMSNLMNHFKMNILGPELHQIHSTFTQYHHKLQSLTADTFSKSELNNMLKSSSDSSTNTDPNYMKLMNLINKSILSSQERLEQTFDEKFKKILSSSMLLNAMNATDGNNKGNSLLPDAMKKQFMELRDEVTKIAQESSMKLHRMEEDILFVKDQIHYLELYRLENISEIQKIEKARQVETEQLKILQKRISNLSVDKLLDDLKSVHKKLIEKPTTEQVNAMIGNIENTFKEHLGENVNGLKSLVHQVYRHIQHKVDREDIKNLISSRLAQMEKEIVVREEELYHLASTTRCLSCGQLPRESWQSANSLGSANSSKKPQQVIHFPPGMPNRRDFSPPGGNRSNTSPLQPQESIISQLSAQDGYSPMDDDLTEGNNLLNSVEGGNHSTFVTSDASAVNPHSLSNSEHIYALLTGQAGLKPIQLQHSPMFPRPHTTAAQSASSSSSQQLKRKTTQEKIPDPVYRKAKLSAHIKEMVKVGAPAIEQYGYNPVNPLYVLEGGAVYEQDGETIGSRQLLGSHSLTSLPTKGNGNTTNPNKPIVNEYAMVNDPRAIKATNKKINNNTNNIDILVLPDIHTSSNGVSSKPNSPGSYVSRESGGGSVSRRGRSSSNSTDNRGTTGSNEPQIVISQVKLQSYI